MSPSAVGTRGLVTLGRATIPCSLEADLPHCGDGVESLAFEIHLVGDPHMLYNVYSRQDCMSLGISHVCAPAAPIIVGGDFNAYLPIMDPHKRPNVEGLHIVDVLEIFPQIALLNIQQPTHVRGGVLYFTFATVTIVERIRWCFNGTVTSDHFGTVTILLDAGPTKQ